MLKQKLLLLFRVYKEKLYLGTIIFLLLMIVLKNGSNYYLETVTEISPKPIETVESTDLFNQSIPWVLEEGADGESKVVYRTKEGTTNKERYKTEVITEAKQQKEKQGTLEFSQYKVQIENTVSAYIQTIKNQSYKESIKYYYNLTSHSSPDITKYNYESVIKVNGNPIITGTTPLYNYSSSKAVAVTNLEGQFEDKVTGKTTTTFDIYTIWDGQEFKILNPEYLSFSVKGVSVEKLVQGTNTSRSHYLSLDVSNFFIKFPNRIYFALNAKTTENVLFNKVKVEITDNKTGVKYYQGVVTYNDVTEKAEWVRTVYKGKAGYKTTFYVPVEFKKEEFSTIYDKMYKSNQFALNDLTISVKPVNDMDVYLNYSTYKFNLNGDPIQEESTTKDNQKGTDK